MNTNIKNTFDWNCKHTWKQSAINTMWCLIGCSFGDMMTIYYFQVNEIPWSMLSIMALAMLNGIISSIILETFILLKQMKLMAALKTAFGMSLISMISMERLTQQENIFINYSLMDMVNKHVKLQV